MIKSFPSTGMEKNDEGWNKVEKKRGWKDREREAASKKSSSFAEVVARNGMLRGEKGRKTDLKETHPQSGPPGFREEEGRELKVRPITYNGKTFSGFVTHPEAIKNIYQE